MRPLRLRMQAFGPFSGHVTIDFRVVESGGLFLIHGQTGAGKTSILDGLCFSLFGTSSGADRAPSDLRSDLANSDLKTETVLEFALGRDVYRIKRSPSHQIQKANRDKPTLVQTSAELWKKKWDQTSDQAWYHSSSLPFPIDDGEWQLLTSNAKSTTAEVIKLLGMTENQFRQVVVLPQNQFRRFLQAGSGEREELLEQLFRTHRYSRIAEALNERAKNLQQQLTNSRQGIDSQLAVLEVSDLNQLEDRLSATRNRINELEISETDLIDRLNQASFRLEKAREAARIRAEVTQLEEKRSRFDLDRPEHQHNDKRLEEAQRAQPVQLIDERLTTFEKDIQILHKQREQEAQILARAEADLEAARKMKVEHDSGITENQARLIEIEEQRTLLRDAKTLLEATAKAKALTQEVSRQNADLKELEEKNLQLRNRLPDLIDQGQTLRDRHASLSALLAQRDQLLNRRSEIDAISLTLSLHDQKLLQLQSAHEELARSEQEIASANDTLQRAKLSFHLSQAARLAAELEPGRPCPVCGSSAHPAPAHHHAGAPTNEDLERLESVCKNKFDEFTKKRLLLNSLDTEIKHLRSDLEKRLLSHPDGNQNFASIISAQSQTLSEEIQANAQAVKAAEEAGLHANSLKNQTSKIESEILSAEADQKVVNRKLEESRTALALAKQTAEDLQARVPESRRDPQAITERGKILKTIIDEFEARGKAVSLRLEQGLSSRDSSQARLATLDQQLSFKFRAREDATVALSNALNQAGFSSIEECRHAALSPSEFKRLDELRRQFDQEDKVVQTRLSELIHTMKDLPDWTIDLNARRHEHQNIEAESRTRAAELISQRSLACSLDSARSRLSDLLSSVQSLEKKFTVSERLAQVANGRDRTVGCVSLPRYVLGTRLDEVLEQASRRLHEMSRGQFVLKRVREIEEKNKLAGLDLEVEDSISGTARAAASLSGGEGFLASLALALGLSDVVQSHLGGVRLDAVFVDEGFGTLDPEALDQAIKILSELQAGGRMVGIISHVPELKSQIARRLFVKKSPEGSTVSWSLATC